MACFKIKKIINKEFITMSNRFVDNVTPLNAETLNGFEEDLKEYTDEQVAEILKPATQTVLGGVKIWVSGTTLNISTT